MELFTVFECGEKTISTFKHENFIFLSLNKAEIWRNLVQNSIIRIADINEDSLRAVWYRFHLKAFILLFKYQFTSFKKFDYILFTFAILFSKQSSSQLIFRSFKKNPLSDALDIFTYASHI